MKINLRNILSIAAMSLVLPASLSFAKEIPLDRVAAIVNDSIVMESEVKQRLTVVKQQLAARNTRAPSDSTLRKQVLERLVLESIQQQLAERQGIRISDSQLNTALGNIAAQNGLSLEQFREALIAEGQDYAAVREQIRGELLISSVQQNLVNRRIRVSEQELQNFLNSEAGQSQISAEYQLGHILIAVPSQAAPELIQKKEREAADVYKKLVDGADFAETAVEFSDAPNALKGGDLGWRKAAELPKNFSDTASDLDVGEYSKPVRSPSGFHIIYLKDKRGGSVQFVEQRLVSHILIKPSEIRTPAQSKQLIDQLYQRISRGENFSELALEYSDDPGSASEGGSLGWAQDGQMVPEFEEIMNATPIGAVSQPFESRFGWHILTVLDKRSEDFGEELQENRARAAIRKRKFNEELNTWLREIRSQAYIEFKES